MRFIYFFFFFWLLIKFKIVVLFPELKQVTTRNVLIISILKTIKQFICKTFCKISTLLFSYNTFYIYNRSKNIIFICTPFNIIIILRFSIASLSRYFFAISENIRTIFSDMNLFIGVSISIWLCKSKIVKMRLKLYIVISLRWLINHFRISNVSTKQPSIKVWIIYVYLYIDVYYMYIFWCITNIEC